MRDCWEVGLKLNKLYLEVYVLFEVKAGVEFDKLLREYQIEDYR